MLQKTLPFVLASMMLFSCKHHPEMTYRTNSHSGDKVSLLGFGCMRFETIDDENGNKVVNQEIANRLIDSAIECGVNYFDCAPVYLDGQCEKATGIALKRHKRSDFFIATKMSNYADFSIEYAKEMYYNSFKVLQVDYIDYYLLHSIGFKGIEGFNARFIDNGLLDFLLEEKKAGRIRNLGWSFHGEVESFDYVLNLKGIQWDFCQIQMNYVDWKNADGKRNVDAEYLYGELVKHNVPAVIMEPLRGGRLASLSSVAMNELKKVHPDQTAAEWAFRYVGSYDNVLTVLTGMNKPEHLTENLATFSPLVKLSEEEFKTLEKVSDIILNAAYIPCTECQYCMPCPFGVDIPCVFAAYNESVTEGREITTNDIAVKQAAECRHCEVCQVKCPQRIKISKEMSRLDSLYQQIEKKEKTF
ncbi:MAG: aldo/keto reductase [Bacteroidales bacterium]|jgi:predicted aldo/keto reductase-like oxidoreductase|nr:aldo/keto reductase [Bacteroidales bacterium]